MKLEMNGSEFATFCSQLTNGNAFVRVHELETELSEARADNESIREDRNYYQTRAQRLGNENDDLMARNGEVQRELNAIRAEVVRLQDLLVPNRVERAYSRAFNLYLTGQKIFAIKEVRALLNIGLKEAKDVVEGNFLDANYALMYTLSQIFRDLGKAELGETQRLRLRSVVGDSVQTDDLNLILSGQFPSPAA
jgi:hypothetical protein